MDLAHVLHMNGDVEEASYANNSLIQVCIYNYCQNLKVYINIFCNYIFANSTEFYKKY
jgi:hypothetical protein